MEQTTSTPSVLRALSNQMADAVTRISTALVLVDGRERQPASGIVYAPNLILTANHVLERQDQITIQTHDARKLSAQAIGRDQTSDLAVLRVPDLQDVVPATATQEEGRVGQLVLAVGRSSAEGPMASSGIISAVSGPLRSRQGIVLERSIRTDAIPYPGFSGGALIDTQGNLLGMLTTGIVSNVALAIPVEIALSIAATLEKQGHVKRGYLGISSQFIQIPAVQRLGRAQENGLLIVQVDENGPAQRGGIIVGDILLTLDGQVVRDAEDLHLLLTGERVGKTVAIEVIRGNTLQTLQVAIGQRS